MRIAAGVHGGKLVRMQMLAINTGSSSVRLAALRVNGKGMDKIAEERRTPAPDVVPATVVRDFLASHGLPAPTAVVHRVVHGGARLTQARLIDNEVEREIEALAPLAPLHNPRALAWIAAARQAIKAAPHIAVFDTAFFADMPAVATQYALPHELVMRHRIRRYGFHGLAHEAMWHRWRALRPAGGSRLISLQLGAGCSITATADGKPLDTSMGFSPLEGLVMATRSGDIDPGLATFLHQAAGVSPDDLHTLLNRASGLLGVSSLSADMRAIVQADTPATRLAFALYCYRARKYIGAYLAVLGGVDAIVFGGGVGENLAPVREAILSGWDWIGLRLDTARNAAAIGREGRIAADNSAVEAWVTPVDEARMMAEQALSVLEG